MNKKFPGQEHGGMGWIYLASSEPLGLRIREKIESAKPRILNLTWLKTPFGGITCNTLSRSCYRRILIICCDKRENVFFCSVTYVFSCHAMFMRKVRQRERCVSLEADVRVAIITSMPLPCPECVIHAAHCVPNCVIRDRCGRYDVPRVRNSSFRP